MEDQMNKALSTNTDGGTALDSLLCTAGDSLSTGEEKGPRYALYEVLVNHLGWVGSDELNTYTPEQWKALRQVANEIATAIHTSTKQTDAQDLISIDFHHIVRVIRRLKKAHGLTELGVMILLDNIVQGRLWKDVPHCNSAADFFRLCEHLIGFSSSRARDFQVRGHAFRRHWKVLRGGCGSIAGLSIEEICLKHLTKLGYFDKAVELFHEEEALRLFKECTARGFASKVKDAIAKSADAPVSNAPIDKKRTPKAKAPIEDLQLSGVQLKALHIIASGGNAKILAMASNDQIELATSRFLEDRREKNLAIRAEVGHKLYDVKRPFEVNKELMELANAQEIIDRIRSGLAIASPRRRTIAVLNYRLASEPYFRPYWQHPRMEVHYKSFAAFAAAELGMGEELRDYLRVGRNLAKFSYILDGLDEIDTDAMFYKLRYLDDAVVTHQADIALIRARLANLSVREFAKFAQQADYDQQATRIISRQYREHFAEFMGQINSFIEKGLVVDVIECYGPNESLIIDTIMSEVREDGNTVTATVEPLAHRDVA